MQLKPIFKDRINYSFESTLVSLINESCLTCTNWNIESSRIEVEEVGEDGEVGWEREVG